MLGYNTRLKHSPQGWLYNDKTEVMIMGMTMTQKILASHAGIDMVKAGQLIMADVDMVL